MSQVLLNGLVIEEFMDGSTKPLSGVLVTLKGPTLSSPIRRITNGQGYYSVYIDIGPNSYVDLEILCSKAGYKAAYEFNPLGASPVVRVQYSNPRVPSRVMRSASFGQPIESFPSKVTLKSIKVLDDTDYFGAGEIYIHCQMTDTSNNISHRFNEFFRDFRTPIKKNKLSISSGKSASFSDVLTIPPGPGNQVKLRVGVRDDDHEVTPTNPFNDTSDMEILMEDSFTLTTGDRGKRIIKSAFCELEFEVS